MLAIQRPLTSFLRHFLPTLSRWRGRSLHGRCLIMLPHQGIARLVTVILVVNIPLLLDLRIALPRILSLIDRERCRRWSRTAVPFVPSAPMLRPVIAPMIAPAW
jgi:hypothetical protein